MIIYMKGNILDRTINKSPVLAHGVNCRGVFGAGLAKQIADEYPEVKENYLLKYKTVGWKLGDVQRNFVDGSFCPLDVFNIATQQYYGRDKRIVYCDYEAIESCLIKLFNFCEQHKLLCSIPKIGCGLANGDWSIIESIIKKTMMNKSFDLQIWEL